MLCVNLQINTINICIKCINLHFEHDLFNIISLIVIVAGDGGIIQSFTKNEQTFTKTEIFTRYLKITRNLDVDTIWIC